MALWLINTYVPMASGINKLLNAVVIICTAVWVLKAFGLWSQIINYSPH